MNGELVVWFFAGVGVACTFLYIALSVHRFVADRRCQYVPPPDRSTLRPAQLVDEQARYIRSMERQS